MLVNWKVVIGVIFGLIIAVALSIWVIRVPRWPNWTGFNNKTAWDLMELIIIPAVLAIGGFLYSRAQRKADDEREFERQRLAVLLAYKKELVSLEHELKSRQQDAELERDGVNFVNAEKI